MGVPLAAVLDPERRMPQVKKPEVRARILDAALEVFATEGFAGAAMTDIAARAGIGTASIYRYYASKDELVAAVLPPALVQRFEALLDRRVRALARNEPEGDMLQFWLANRLAVVVLLTERGERFVELLVKHTLAQLRGRITARVRFVLTEIFDNTRRLLARVLATYADPDELREAIATFWTYQIAGIRALAADLDR